MVEKFQPSSEKLIQLSNKLKRDAKMLFHLMGPGMNKKNTDAYLVSRRIVNEHGKNIFPLIAKALVRAVIKARDLYKKGEFDKFLLNNYPKSLVNAWAAAYQAAVEAGTELY